jgi:hypothetical protein
MVVNHEGDPVFRVLLAASLSNPEKGAIASPTQFRTQCVANWKANLAVKVDDHS